MEHAGRRRTRRKKRGRNSAKRLQTTKRTGFRHQMERTRNRSRTGSRRSDVVSRASRRAAQAARKLCHHYSYSVYCLLLLFRTRSSIFFRCPIRQALSEAERRELPVGGITGNEKILPLTSLKEGDTGRYVFDRATNSGHNGCRARDHRSRQWSPAMPRASSASLRTSRYIRTTASFRTAFGCRSSLTTASRTSRPPTND